LLSILRPGILGGLAELTFMILERPNHQSPYAVM
jgi:hypothetical protein